MDCTKLLSAISLLRRALASGRRHRRENERRWRVAGSVLATSRYTCWRAVIAQLFNTQCET